MIVLSVGMPRAGSGWHYNLIHDLMETAGYTDARIIREKIKKALRDDAGKMSDERRSALSKELGDVLWYVAALCSEPGLTRGDGAQANLDKLAKRQETGKLHGSGDDR